MMGFLMQTKLTMFAWDENGSNIVFTGIDYNGSRYRSDK